MNTYPQNIKQSGLTIYDEILPSDKDLYIPSEILQRLLNATLVGFNVGGMALRTRSKAVKQKICELLGYPVPVRFKKTHPRFPGQNFEVYIQSARNVQIWNADVALDRRYVFVKVDENALVAKVKVISGAELVTYDKTGTLTHKYQALMPEGNSESYVSEKDTCTIEELICTSASLLDLSQIEPCAPPCSGKLLPVQDIYDKLTPLVGQKVKHISATQERNRGAELHKLVCEKLGFSSYEDNGCYPDIRNQLVEIKLQTSRTIDLGLHSPQEDCILMNVAGQDVSCKDIRYVIFGGEIRKGAVQLNRLYVVTGKDFPSKFSMVKSKNSKRQLPLPSTFFDLD